MDPIIIIDFLSKEWMINMIITLSFIALYFIIAFKTNDEKLPIILKVSSLLVLLAFTPNFDGVNDTYKIKNNGVDIVSFNISIYNRLGQLVFNSNDINFNWNGRFKSVQLQPQVFDFFIEMTCAGNTNLFTKGNITLLR